jgi:hypothetical protein
LRCEPNQATRGRRAAPPRRLKAKRSPRKAQTASAGAGLRPAGGQENKPRPPGEREGGRWGKPQVSPTDFVACRARSPSAGSARARSRSPRPRHL